MLIVSVILSLTTSAYALILAYREIKLLSDNSSEQEMTERQIDNVVINK